MYGFLLLCALTASYVTVSAAAATTTDVAVKANGNRVVILSFDGFRWDYINKFNTPNFDNFAKEGVKAEFGVKPAFATKTFPNHYTIVTGLYEESHGIVNNRMYDPEFDASFGPGNNETRWWDGGQPIWITARLQKRTSAVYFWPGSETRIEGVYANYFVPYNESVPFVNRIDQVIEWLTVKKADIVATYFHEPDGAGHRFGAFSDKVEKAVVEIDSLLGHFMQRLEENGLSETTNVIVVSDHGMTNITADEEHVIVLSDYLDMETEVKLVPQKGVVVMILPHEGKKDIVYKKLVDAKRPMRVFKKEDIPEQFHFKNHKRILPILVLADEGYTIVLKRPIDFTRVGPGGHGYDNNLPSMKPIFFARGPDFKKNVLIKSTIETVNIYSLMCHLMDIQPAPNNGSWEVFSDVLVNSASSLASTWAVIQVTFFVFIRVFFKV